LFVVRAFYLLLAADHHGGKSDVETSLTVA
jgi:hypothetical protein